MYSAGHYDAQPSSLRMVLVLVMAGLEATRGDWAQL